jgi:hypothetical protein
MRLTDAVTLWAAGGALGTAAAAGIAVWAARQSHDAEDGVYVPTGWRGRFTGAIF